MYLLKILHRKFLQGIYSQHFSRPTYLGCVVEVQHLPSLSTLGFSESNERFTS